MANVKEEKGASDYRCRDNHEQNALHSKISERKTSKQEKRQIKKRTLIMITSIIVVIIGMVTFLLFNQPGKVLYVAGSTSENTPHPYKNETATLQKIYGAPKSESNLNIRMSTQNTTIQLPLYVSKTIYISVEDDSNEDDYYIVKEYDDSIFNVEFGDWDGDNLPIEIKAKKRVKKEPIRLIAYRESDDTFITSIILTVSAQ